jgi:hypothetical protein
MRKIPEMLREGSHYRAAVAVGSRVALLSRPL